MNIRARLAQTERRFAELTERRRRQSIQIPAENRAAMEHLLERFTPDCDPADGNYLQSLLVAIGDGTNAGLPAGRFN